MRLRLPSSRNSVGTLLCTERERAPLPVERCKQSEEMRLEGCGKETRTGAWSEARATRRQVKGWWSLSLKQEVATFQRMSTICCRRPTQDTAALTHTGAHGRTHHAHTCTHTRTRIAQSRPCTLWQTHPHGRVHVQAPSCAQKCPRSHLSGESHEVKKCPRSHGGKQTRRVHALHVRLRCNCSDMQKRLPNWGALAFIRCNCSDTQKPERCRPNL